MNQLSRESEEGKYSIREAEERLEVIKNMPGKRGIVKMAASGIGSGCFCYLLGGGLEDMAAAFLSAFFLYGILLCFGRREKRTSKIVTNMAGGFCVSFFAVLFYRLGLGNAPGSILVGSVMPLVPGVSLVNAVRDFADGDYIGGGVRFIDALMVALGIAMGVGIMYFLYFHLTGGILL